MADNITGYCVTACLTGGAAQATIQVIGRAIFSPCELDALIGAHNESHSHFKIMKD